MVKNIYHKKVIIFIQVPYSEDYGPMRKASGTYFPIGIGYLSAYVKQYGYHVHFFDPNVQEITMDDIINFIGDKEPLLIGLSFMTPQFMTAQSIADGIKHKYPQLPIAVGGAHPSVMPERTLKEIKSVDFAVFGEGEETLLELLEFLSEEKGKLDTIKGLAWRGHHDVIVNAPRPLISSMEHLPFPDRSLIDQTVYKPQSFLSYFKKPQVVYTSRGCPGRCVFCASGHKLYSRSRERSIENVIEEIKQLQARYDIDYLLIKDDTFTIRQQRIREFCKAFTKNFPGLPWHCMGRVNTVNYDVLAMMKDAGLTNIFLGIESGNDEILKRAGKGITTKQARRAVEACDKLGIRTVGAFILGLPGETYETLGQTIDFACSLPLTIANFSILIPYPGTKVFDDYVPHSDNEPIDYKRFIGSTGIFYIEEYTGLEGINIHDLPGLVSRALRKFYLRPSQVYRMLRSATPAMLWGYVRGAVSLVNKEWCLYTTKHS